MRMVHITQEARRFYDGGILPSDGDPGSPPNPEADPRILLERHTEDGAETFSHGPDVGTGPLHLAGAQDRCPPARGAAA